MQSEQFLLSSILGVDSGGTFTDIVHYMPSLSANELGQLNIHKVPSTPKNPVQGLFSGMSDLKVASDCVVVHGSTVQPLMARYLNNLREHIRGPVRIMQSSGSSISAAVAAQEPVRTVLSGPAGGVIGAFHIAKIACHDHVITLDMGALLPKWCSVRGALHFPEKLRLRHE